ncbi:efflux RND transporter periplasmic adaptor subunit [Tistrella sp. BH-R2-4]|uniref:Efflux RND transporter periplasmic adaptor subunit n=1 Tax=Tistrella arctica TaxID=3133430 RepID=A0ABU9YE19_9PROT
MTCFRPSSHPTIRLALHIRRPAMAATLLAAALALGGCKEPTRADAPPPERPVRVATVAYTNAAETRDFVGVVRARTESALGFRVGGKLVERPVDVGDRVTAGQVVAKLDHTDLGLQVASAEAELSAARSSYAQAKSDEARYASLRSRGFAPVAEYERKKSALDAAASRVEQARRSLDLARNQLDYGDLQADADGVVVSVGAEPGQVVATGQTVVTIARDGPREALVALPEAWLAEARRAEATVSLWAEGDHRYAATLRELAPQADPATRTYAARFEILSDDDAAPALGMTATVTLALPGEGPVARLPLAAVMNNGQGPAVFVVDPATSTLDRRPVALKGFTEDVAMVQSGLDAGERVVTLGVHQLREGVAVRVLDGG